MKQQTSKQLFIDVSVPEHYQKLLEKTYKTFYKVELKTYDKELQKEISTVTHKTFELFESLYSILKKNYSLTLKFPSKSMFSFKSKDELDKRRSSLDSFLKDCFRIRQIADDLAMKSFINNFDIDLESIDESRSISVLKITDLIISENFKFYLGAFGMHDTSPTIFLASYNSWKGNHSKYQEKAKIFDEKKDDKTIYKDKLIAYTINSNGLKRIEDLELALPSKVIFLFFQGEKILVGLANGSVYLQRSSNKNSSIEDKVFKVFSNTKLRGLGADSEIVYALSNSKIKYALVKDFSIVYGKLSHVFN